MTNDELKKILESDIPDEINPEYNTKAILQKCKTKREKQVNYKFKITFSIVSLFLFAFIVFSVLWLNNKPRINKVSYEKISVLKIENKGSDDMINNPDAYLIEWYGIEINIRCDYSKHPEYDKWLEEYDGSVSEDDPRGYDYYLNRYLNRVFYEEIKNNLNNAYSHSFWPGDQIINVSYSAKKGDEETMSVALSNMEELINEFYESSDYEYLCNLSNEDYIIKIDIIERWPRFNGDE